MTIHRQRFLVGTGAAAIAALVPREFVRAAATHRLEIEETSWEIRPGLIERIVTAGGAYPGTTIRALQGSTIDVAVRNRTTAAVAIHWHGLAVSPLVDGVPALGTPPVEAGRERVYRLPLTVGGTRWYHSHDGANLLFGGLSGPLIVDRRHEPGRYDREVLLMLHEFVATTPSKSSMSDNRPSGAPSLSAPLTSHAAGVGVAPPMTENMAMRDTVYGSYAINGKALGFGEPVRVKRGERVRFRVINASATRTHRIALSGHRLEVIELDGNPVPKPHALEAIELGPGERVDALASMESPGVWIFGSTEESAREHGMGVVVAYDRAVGEPQWREPDRRPFTYELFGNPTHRSRSGLDGTYDVVLRKSSKAPDGWSINGEMFPHTTALHVREGGTYRLRFINRSAMEHPMHVHGHSFELSSIDGVRTSGIIKDTVVVRPNGGRIEVILAATNPYRGRYLLHCHNDQHVEGGMATILSYA